MSKGKKSACKSWKVLSGMLSTSLSLLIGRKDLQTTV
jgi:hypothetical protein